MPAAHSTVAMARELIARKRYSQAIDILNDKLARNPDDLNALEALGLAYFELQDYNAVERVAFQTTRLASTRARTWCNWGMALRKLGRLEEAREAQERALHLDPGYRRAQIELAKIDRLQWDAPPAMEDLPLPSTFGRDDEEHLQEGSQDGHDCPVCGCWMAPGEEECTRCGGEAATTAIHAPPVQEAARPLPASKSPRVSAAFGPIITGVFVLAALALTFVAWRMIFPPQRSDIPASQQPAAVTMTQSGDPMAKFRGLPPLGPSDTVYYVAGRSFYHRQGCPYLAGPPMEVDKGEAEDSLWLKPCNKCKP
ncbi:MAG: tetratricopeptide repeat protein [Armatimonadetes bacterium]|nr:tetratricopeptide repeat protein [Armatimonadota bacterium]